MQEKTKQKTLEAYRGDLLWSILAAMHGMCKSRLTAPSYSDMVERLSGRPQKKKQVNLSNAETIESVEKMLDLFS